MFDVNKFAVNQDYEFASELIQALEKNIPREDPELIRKKAQLENDALFVGMGRKFRIW